MYRLEELMEIGGTRKDIVLLIIGGISLILSLLNSRLHFLPLPFDIAWVAIILCGVPIIMEAIIGLLILGAGIYYLIKEKDDPESKKIYSIVSVVGAAVAVAAAIILITHI